MYKILEILLFISILSVILFSVHRKKVIRKINSMEKEKKCLLLNELVERFGYCYCCPQDIFSSRIDAWQKQAGYTALYDEMAVYFQMVFDCLPVYFDYNGKTWLIEFWKGQYGIHTGAEIGIYHASRILSPQEYKTAHFTCATEKEILPLSLTLCFKNGHHIRLIGCHWWLTAFVPGCFSQPSDLLLKSSLLFPDTEMCSAFLKGLYRADIPFSDITVCGRNVSFHFAHAPQKTFTRRTRFFRWFSQWKNKLFCHIFCFFTRPFHDTKDRLLYLFYCLPFTFRRVLRLHRFDRRCHRKKHGLGNRR